MICPRQLHIKHQNFISLHEQCSNALLLPPLRCSDHRMQFSVFLAAQLWFRSFLTTSTLVTGQMLHPISYQPLQVGDTFKINLYSIALKHIMDPHRNISQGIPEFSFHTILFPGFCTQQKFESINFVIIFNRLTVHVTLLNSLNFKSIILMRSVYQKNLKYTQLGRI